MKNRLLANNKVKTFFFILYFLPFYISAQDQAQGSITTEGQVQIVQKETTVKTPVRLTRDFQDLPPSTVKKRIRLIAATNIVGYSAAMLGLYSDWYSNYPQSNFH